MSLLIETPDQYLRRYYLCKQLLQLPLKINLYFTFLQSALKNDPQPSTPNTFQGFSPLLYLIFSQLSLLEKSFYLYSNIQSIKRQYQKLKLSPQHKSKSSIPLQSGISISTSGKICQSVLGMAYWSKVKIIFTYQNRKLKLQTKNRNQLIDLRLYLLRKSKKYKDTLVLQAISQIVPTLDKKISLSFTTVVFDQVYNQLLKCIISYRNEQLTKIILQELSTIANSNPTQISYITLNSKTVSFLDSKTINQFLQFKQQTIKKIFKNIIPFQLLFTTPTSKIYIEKIHHHYYQNNIPILYKLQSDFSCTKNTLKKLFLEKYKSKNYKYLIQSEQLEKFAHKYTALYQKMLFKANDLSFNVVQQIVIEEINQKQQGIDNEEVLFQKGLNGVKFNGFLQFLIIKIKPIDTNSKLYIYASFQTQPSQPLTPKSSPKSKSPPMTSPYQQTILMFLLQFSQMLTRHQSTHSTLLKILQQLRSPPDHSKFNPQNQFVTLASNCTHQNRNQYVLDTEDLQHRTENQFNIEPKTVPKLARNSFSVPDKLFSSQMTLINKQVALISIKSDIQTSQILNTNKQLNYLTAYYQFQPTPIQITPPPPKQLQKKHFLYDDWYRKPKGGLICKDNTVIAQQKKVANYVLSALSQNTLQNKASILNLSIPVTICKPESHLHSVAKNLSFAPTILQKTHTISPLQRIKLSIIYALSVTVSSISVSKPFNPLLGQTLQVWIDQCPAYFQQINNYPPIIAYYMIGRGYKLYGCIGPKATFGFNSIIGYNQQKNFIQFDDDTIIQLGFGKMVISGILLGQRTFNFQDKIYVIDFKNRLFCQLKLGDDKRSFFSKLNQPDDAIFGKIYQVTSQFITLFHQSDKPIYPTKPYIIRQLSTLQGIWNGKIKFDHKLYIDFQLANGCVVNMQRNALPSDSNNRKDIQYLKQGCINASQNQKQKLENEGRKDHKLRRQWMSTGEEY